MSVDIHDLLLSPIEGYPKLARHMGFYSKCAIYRRFSALNSQNILYLQAELVHLERKLRRLEANDRASPEGDRPLYSKDWYWLNNSAFEENSDQLQTVLAIRSKLKDYNDFVIQQSVIQNLADPSPYELRSLQDWLERPNMGNLALIGADRDTWGALDQPIDPNLDLTTIKSAVEDDAFSRWFSKRFIVWFHYFFGYRVKKPLDPETGIVSYQEETVKRYISHITTIVASLLPILAIVILYCVGSMNLRLGLIAVFTVIFTVCLAFFSSISRGEIFIATSTFAAVQVVFISTSSGWNGST